MKQVVDRLEAQEEEEKNSTVEEEESRTSNDLLIWNIKVEVCQGPKEADSLEIECASCAKPVGRVIFDRTTYPSAGSSGKMIEMPL